MQSKDQQRIANELSLIELFKRVGGKDAQQMILASSMAILGIVLAAQ